MPAEQTAIHRKGFYQLLKIMGIGLFICALAGYAAWAYAQERHDLPPFDQEKAKALSPEKRAEYDRLLFNELPDWSWSSRRHNLFTREAEWKKMAADGHELSYWMLQTRSPTMGRFSNTKALKRLEELAQQGDASAMCAYGWVLNDPYGKDKRHVLAVEYVKQGAKLGHPECKRQLGNYFLGISADARLSGVEPNRPEGFSLLVDAARSGYSGSGDIWLYFDQQGVSNVENVKRTYCWASVYEQFQAKTPERLTTKAYLLDRTREYAEKHHRKDLLTLADTLQKTQYSLENCIDLGLKPSQRK